MSRLDGAGGAAAILIRHFLQVPWPPQVESMAMPFQLAASNRVTPYGTRTGRSLKSRLTRTGWLSPRPLSRGALPPRLGFLCRPLGRPVRGDPAGAPLVAVEHQVGGLDRA